jgi:alkylation response protein AidB-like acyl-CoA dehydrogenase
MRATATHGITLENVFVPDDDSLTVHDSFVNMTLVSRGSFVGNQVALSSVYVGAAQAIYDFAMNYLTSTKYADSDDPIGSSDVHRQLIGKMRSHLDTAFLWARRQIALETADPGILAKGDVVANWRIAKGEIADNCFQVAVHAMKACGTSNTGMEGPISRGLRDLSMALVQGFPAERGRLEAASYLVSGSEGAQFGTLKS